MPQSDDQVYRPDYCEGFACFASSAYILAGVSIPLYGENHALAEYSVKLFRAQRLLRMCLKLYTRRLEIRLVRSGLYRHEQLVPLKESKYGGELIVSLCVAHKQRALLSFDELLRDFETLSCLLGLKLEQIFNEEPGFSKPRATSGA